MVGALVNAVDSYSMKYLCSSVMYELCRSRFSVVKEVYSIGEMGQSAQSFVWPMFADIVYSHFNAKWATFFLLYMRWKIYRLRLYACNLAFIPFRHTMVLVYKWLAIQTLCSVVRVEEEDWIESCCTLDTILSILPSSCWYCRWSQRRRCPFKY